MHHPIYNIITSDRTHQYIWPIRLYIAIRAIENVTRSIVISNMSNWEIKECDHPSQFIRSSITNVLLLKAIYLIKKYCLSDRSYMFHPSWLPIPHLSVCVRSSSNDCPTEITIMTYRLIIHAIYYHSRLVIHFPKTSGVIE